jgi:xylitol oxidase
MFASFANHRAISDHVAKMTTNPCNWAGNYTYQASSIHSPQTLEELCQIVRDSRKVRALGTRHSFNDIADCAENLISLEQFDRIIAIDRAQQTVTIESGVKYGQLGEFLHQEGFALHNLASLPHISVAGACATATHGSGENNGSLATAVVAMELITAHGEVLVVSRDRDENFPGMVVALGGLGIVTKLTLEIQPTFAVRQDVYENLPLAQLEKNFDAIQASGYSVSLFTDWQGDSINQLWLKRRTINQDAAAPTFFGAALAPADRHPIAEISAENCTPQMGIPGPWHQRLPHFRMNFTPSSGDELQSEYFVPRQHAIAALRAVAHLHEKISPLLLISEIRTIAADDLWLSPCYQQACVAIHFTWKPDWPAVRELLPMIESQLAPFDARPHWGKLFTMEAARLRSLYKKLPDFQRLLRSYDPNGKFRNAFLDRYIFGV